MSNASQSMSPSTSTLRLSSSQISIVSASSADSNDSTEQTIFPSPGRGKVVGVCKNCSYSFRTRSDFDLTEFCNKDCQTSFTLKTPQSPSCHNNNILRYPSPVPFHPNNGRERAPDRPLTAREIKESIFRFQQEMDYEEDREREAQRPQPVSPRGGPPLSPRRAISEPLTIRNPTPPPPFPTGFDSPVIGVATTTNGGGALGGGGRKKALLPPSTDSSFDPRAKPPLSPMVTTTLKKQTSFSLLDSLRSGSSSPGPQSNNNSGNNNNNNNTNTLLLIDPCSIYSNDNNHDNDSDNTHNNTVTSTSSGWRSAGRNGQSPSPSPRRGGDSHGSSSGTGSRAASPGARLLNWTKRVMFNGSGGNNLEEAVPVSALEYLTQKEQ